MAKSLKQLLIIGLVLSLSLLLAMTALASSGGNDVCADSINIAQAGTCGDGICDPYVSENKTTCPADCGTNAPPAAAAPTSTPTPTPTPTPTATFVPLLFFPIVVSPTPTVTVTVTGVTPTATPTPVVTETAVAGQQVGCDLVSYESRTNEWQSGYGVFAKEYVPNQSDQREVFVCRVPPLQQICLPIYDGLMEAANGDQNNVVLIDCTSGGSCEAHDAPLVRDGNLMCATITVAGALSCTGGCALSPAGQGGLLRPPSMDISGLLRLVPAGAVAPIACLLALILIMGVGLLIFVSRRARNRELTGSDSAAD